MRVCPFAGCQAPILDRLFACSRHWFQLSVMEQRATYEAYWAYQRGAIDVDELRRRQARVLEDHYRRTR